MKKLGIFALLFALFIACDDDDDDSSGDGGYITDNLTVEEKTKSLLAMGYSNKNGAIPALQQLRIIAEDEFGDDLNHISLADSSVGDLGFSTADSLIIQFGYGMLPYLVHNNEDINASQLFTIPENSISKTPIAGVRHTVSKNDTAWRIDAKVKFFKDTTDAKIRVQTYMLGNIDATKNDNQGYNLLQAGAGGNDAPIAENDTVTSWNTDILSLDSTETLVSNGETYTHQYILMDKSETPMPGRPLESYWPFGARYIVNDVIGTEDTPIRSYFLLPSESDKYPDYSFDAEFLTVLYIQDPMTLNWLYLNSYQSAP